MLLGLASIPVSHWIADRGGKNAPEKRLPVSGQEHIAKLTNWHDAVWLEGTRPPKRYPQLKLGKRLAIESGLIEITYNTGARVVIEGPAEFFVGSSVVG